MLTLKKSTEVLSNRNFCFIYSVFFLFYFLCWLHYMTLIWQTFLFFNLDKQVLLSEK